MSLSWKKCFVQKILNWITSYSKSSNFRKLRSSSKTWATKCGTGVIPFKKMTMTTSSLKRLGADDIAPFIELASRPEISCHPNNLNNGKTSIYKEKA
jgi:hypothetical protein